MGKCLLCGKRKIKGGGPFFKVPQEPRKLEIWRRACGIAFEVNSLVCVDHFQATHLISYGHRTNLMPNAVPTLNLNVLNMFESGRCENGLHSNIQISNETSSEVEKILMLTSDVEKNKTYENSSKQTEPILIQCAMELQIESLKARNRQLLEENKRLSFQELQSSTVMTSVNAIFTEGQVRKMMLNNNKVKWSGKDISNAICIHAAGPRAYRHLYEKGFPLPHVSTLQRWYRKVNIQEGLITVALDLMRELTDMTPAERLTVLAFDEMKVAKTYEYEAMGDYVREPADYVQVVMARGLLKSWKQPVFFDFDCKINVKNLHEIISALYDAGFPVVAMVCDMGTSNQRLWRELGVTITQPWFANPRNPDEKVFVFADAPHLLKLIRNHFITTGYVWNGLKITTSAVAAVMHYAKSDLSITYKITEDHLTVDGLGKQKVKLAAQLMSNTTANAILYFHTQGKKLYEPVETAKLIQLVNDWFDVLNSSVNTFSYPGKEPFGLHLDKQNMILEDMNNFMSQIIIPGKKSIQQFQKAVLVTNKALQLLYEYVKEKYEIDYIVTRRLNQDVLENFFGNIRSKGGLHDHPSPKEFKFRLRKYIIARNEEILQNTGNVEHDSTEWLNTSNPQMLYDKAKHDKSVQQDCTDLRNTSSQQVCEEDVIEALDITIDAIEALNISADVIEALDISVHQDATESLNTSSQQMCDEDVAEYLDISVEQDAIEWLDTSSEQMCDKDVSEYLDISVEQDAIEWLNTSSQQICDEDVLEALDISIDHDAIEWLNTPSQQMCGEYIAEYLDISVDQDAIESLNTSNQKTYHEDVLVSSKEPELEDKDWDIMEDAAIQYIAGYIIRKLHLTEYEDTGNNYFTWVDQVSKGFLKTPSKRFVENIKQLENVFNAVNGKTIVYSKNIKKYLLDKAIHVILPDDVKRFFFKCRIFFRIRYLNHKLKINKAKSRVLRYKKLAKVTQ